MDQITIKENYQKALERIENSATSAGRQANDVKLVVVTKGQSIETIHNAYLAGIRIFGENYVQDAVTKIESLEDKNDLEWHMIGHVQSRKARQVCEKFNWVESLDNLKLALRLDRFSGETGKMLPVLLEFNVSGEGSKFGFSAWNETKWSELLLEIEQMLTLPNLTIRGLMTMPPLTIDPQDVRPYFERLRKLQAYLKKNFGHTSWDELSMGMSADYEIAIQEGATIVRVGTAIMGAR